MAGQPVSRAKRTIWYVILFIPFFVAIDVPFFNRIEPAIAGIPFFYWFQFLLIIIAAVVTGLAYKARI